MGNTVKLSALTPDAKNANRGSERGSQMIERSFRNYGAGRSILLDKHGRIIAGNKSAEAAGSIGMEDVLVVPSDGKRLIAVQRMDLDLLTDKAAKELAIADNRAGELSLDWDPEALKELDDEIDLGQFWTPEELAIELAETDGPREKADDGGPNEKAGDALADYSLIVSCATADEQIATYDALIALGYLCKPAAQ